MAKQYDDKPVSFTDDELSRILDDLGPAPDDYEYRPDVYPSFPSVDLALEKIETDYTPKGWRHGQANQIVDRKLINENIDAVTTSFDHLLAGERSNDELADLLLRKNIQKGFAMEEVSREAGTVDAYYEDLALSQAFHDTVSDLSGASASEMADHSDHVFDAYEFYRQDDKSLEWISAGYMRAHRGESMTQLANDVRVELHNESEILTETDQGRLNEAAMLARIGHSSITAGAPYDHPFADRMVKESLQDAFNDNGVSFEHGLPGRETLDGVYAEAMMNSIERIYGQRIQTDDLIEAASNAFEAYSENEGAYENMPGDFEALYGEPIDRLATERINDNMSKMSAGHEMTPEEYDAAITSAMEKSRWAEESEALGAMYADDTYNPQPDADELERMQAEVYGDQGPAPIGNTSISYAQFVEGVDAIDKQSKESVSFAEQVARDVDDVLPDKKVEPEFVEHEYEEIEDDGPEL